MVINQKCIRDYKLNLDLARYTDPEKKKIADEKYLKSYDVLVNSTGVGTLGRVAQISEVNRPVTSDSHVTIVRPDDQTIDPLYFGYCLKSRQKHIEALGEGSTGQTELSRVLLGDMEIEILEDFREQKVVANFFKAIDDKIELNQQMNEILEDIAKTLFKSWFIDFDPVRAKAEGKPTGLSKEISDLFPDSFEDSEFGEIPKGWQIKEIQELCESISSGGTPKRKQKDYWENGSIDWFKTGELHDTYLLESEEKITDSAVKESSCKLWNKGTILFAIYASPTVGRLGILTKPSTSNQAAAGLIPKESVGMPFLKNLLLFSRKEMQYIASGAAQQNINVGILKEFKVISPNHEIAGHFSKINEPIEKKIFSNLREISYLSQIRDLLLPKLISGELKISDAENIVEETDF